MNCPKCGFGNPDGMGFCGMCGARLHSSASEPERKQVTALFSDLSGYSAMSTRLDPEDVKEITGRIFAEVRRVIARYDGFIEKFAGDGVLALFGVPSSHEDDPLRAIRAAREIHERVQLLSPAYEAKVGAELAMHSGIHTGLALAADVEPAQGTHGVTGDVINVAARLSDLARSGEILVGPETYRRTEGQFAFEAREPARLQGRAEPLAIFKVLGAKEQPITMHGVSGLRARLTGRQAELDRLQEAVARLSRGAGSVIAVSGDAGTGKSRLVGELKASLDTAVAWHEGHCYPYAENIPYFPLMDLLNRVWGIQDGDTPGEIRRKIESGVAGLLGAGNDAAAYIGSLYSLSYPEIEGGSPEFWKLRLFESVKRIVHALAGRCASVFCFEDIHWADRSTLELLRFLVAENGSSALYLLVHRPPFELLAAGAREKAAGRYDEIRLDDLSPSHTAEMVASLLGSDSVPAELRRFIDTRVEGNPFYVEEAINSLIESGVLVRGDSGWRVGRPLTEAAVPSTVQGIISSRLDRLDREMKRVLQEASVIGRLFYHDVLKRITRLERALDGCLSELQTRDLLRVRALQPDLEYIFKHALTQEVVYSGLLKKERQEIHERIALVMEELFQSRLPEFYEAIAFHFARGRSRLKAVRYLMRSGEKSLNRFSVDEAHRYYGEALQLLSGEAGADREAKALLIDLLVEWGSVIYYRGGFVEYEQLLTAHEQTALSLQDKERLGMYYAWLGWTKFWRAKHRDGSEILEKALAIGEETGSARIQGYAACWIAFVYFELGMYAKAISAAEKALEMSKHLPSDTYLCSKPLTALGMVYCFTGDGHRAHQTGRRLLELGEEHDNVRSIVMGHVVTGFGYHASGSFTLAVESGEKAIEASNDPLYLNYAWALLSMCYAGMEQFAKAREIAQRVIDYSAREGTEEFGTYSDIVLGASLVAEGRMAEGVERLQRVSRAFAADGRTFVLATAEHVLGSVYAQMVAGKQRPPIPVLIRNAWFLLRNLPFASRRAQEHLGKAIQVAQEGGMNGILAQAHLQLGRLHKARKRNDQAAACLAKAAELFERCDARTWLRQANEERGSEYLR